MNGSAASRGHVGLWSILGVLLLTGNGVLGTLASPFVLLHRYDGVQYQLLARNRLHGHYEVGDPTHTVHEEGRHPMWRPGLVWIEEGLARCLGSVRNGAAAASALGTSLLELALLCLAWRCFGKKTFLFVLIGFALPAVNSPLLELAVGQGPEVWAAAAIVAGLAMLIEAVRRQSGCWAVAAGTVAGLAEWFRTGNLLLFAVPCAVYGVAALWQRDRRSFCLPAGALAAWLGMAALGERAVPSSVNKTIANLWACRTEIGGPRITEDLRDGSRLTSSLLTYTLVPGTTEIVIDSVIRHSCGRSTVGFFREHAGEIVGAYLQHLQQVLTSGFRGLRLRTGELVLVLFGVSLLFCLARREQAAAATFAVAGAALAHYLGPVVLIAADEPSHYILVAYPLFVLAAARGALQLADLVPTGWNRWRSLPPSQPGSMPWFVLGLGLLLASFWSVPFFQETGTRLRELQQQALQQQAALDALKLEGQRVACRNLCWFVDRDVHSVFLPYATVPELESYVRAHAIDGILTWEEEAMAAFRATPYESLSEFGRALQDSTVFAPPHISGSWRWYAVVRCPYTEEQP